jgi:hypothetical protein
MPIPVFRYFPKTKPADPLCFVALGGANDAGKKNAPYRLPRAHCRSELSGFSEFRAFFPRLSFSDGIHQIAPVNPV